MPAFAPVPGPTPPSKQDVLITWCVQAHLATIPRKQGIRFLQEIDALADKVEGRAMFPAQDEARDWVKRHLPALLKSLK